MSTYRHDCAACQSCDGDTDQPCSWGVFADVGEPAHHGVTCPGKNTCGRPWAGCHHCGALTPCPQPCWNVPHDGDDGNPVLEAAA